MSNTDPVPQQTIPWYRSQQLIMLTVSAVTQLLAAFHLSKYFTTEQIAEGVDAVFQLAAIVTIIRAGVLRVTRPNSGPVALTQKHADNANAAAAVPPTLKPPGE